MSETPQKLNATKHYLAYPEGDFPPYLAYGFRPIFLLLAPYIVISIVLWGLSFAGILPLSFMEHPVEWHIFEFLFGVGAAGIMAFLFTGLPELFPGVVPIVGQPLKWIVGLWFAGRVGFWFIDYLGIYSVATLNIITYLIIIAYVVKPVILDPLQRHASIGYTVGGIFSIMVWFFISMAGWVEQDTISILKVGLGAFMVLELLVLRRVNMEAVNEIMEDQEIDDTFVARPPRYNIAIFTVALYTGVEFFYPSNSVLGWLGFAAGAAILGTLNDFALEDGNILFKPLVLFMMLILLLMGVGYGMLGYGYLFNQMVGLNHFRHFLTTGVFGLSFYMVMIIVSFIHTGRRIKINVPITLSVLLILVATLMRSLIPFFWEQMMDLYLYSSLLWGLAFVLYMVQFFPYLLAPRVDGIPG